MRYGIGMMMQKMWVVLIAGALTLVGCGKASEKQEAAERRGRVAVVDLERVAKAVGWLQEMNQLTGSVEQELKVRLGGLREHLVGTLQGEYRKAGENPSAEVKEQLAALTRSMDEQYMGAVRQMEGEMTKVRQSLGLQYREAMRPAVRKTAQDMGYSIVVSQSDTLYWVEVGSDITDRVIEQLLKDKPKVEPVLPAISLPIPTDAAATQPATGTNTNANGGK